MPHLTPIFAPDIFRTLANDTAQTPSALALRIHDSALVRLP